ncbi:MAG TPA: ABC transporter C-terminal domain-containing protein, partial [Puia sp.]|nr:ABC transporter C-terminal domain-containing protein [Puia sp.]
AAKAASGPATGSGKKDGSSNGRDGSSNGKDGGSNGQAKAAGNTSAPAAPAPAKPSVTAPAPTPAGTPINKESKKELQRQQRIFQELEEKIAKLSEQRSRLEASLSDPGTYSDRNKFVAAETDYKKASEELKMANRQYEQVFEKIMELEKSL